MQIDADKYPSIAAKHGVRGYPTLKLFMSGSPVAASFNERRTADDMLAYLERNNALMALKIDDIITLR